MLFSLYYRLAILYLLISVPPELAFYMSFTITFNILFFKYVKNNEAIISDGNMN